MIRSAALTRAQDGSIILQCLVDHDRVEYKAMTRREVLDLISQGLQMVVEDTDRGLHTLP